MYAWIVPKHKRFIKALVILIVIAALIVGAYYVGNYLSTRSNNKKTPPVKAASTASGLDISTKTVSYTSVNLGDSFNYPSGWTLTDNAGSNMLSVTSPKMTLENSSKKDVSGQVTMVINQNPDPTLSGFKYGDAIAATESQLISYTQPAADQLAQTYISFVSYAGGGSSLSDIGGIYVTGNIGYMAGQDVPETDIYQVSPIIYIDFTQCTNNVCGSNNPALNIPVSLWNNSGFQKPLLAMLESLSLD